MSEYDAGLRRSTRVRLRQEAPVTTLIPLTPKTNLPLPEPRTKRRPRSRSRPNSFVPRPPSPYDPQALDPPKVKKKKKTAPASSRNAIESLGSDLGTGDTSHLPALSGQWVTPIYYGGVGVVVVLCLLFWSSYTKYSTRSPSYPTPCHLPRNPDHFVSCAVSIDLNRALEDVANLRAPDDLFERPHPTLIDPRLIGLFRKAKSAANRAVDQQEDIFFDAQRQLNAISTSSARLVLHHYVIHLALATLRRYLVRLPLTGQEIQQGEFVKGEISRILKSTTHELRRLPDDYASAIKWGLREAEDFSLHLQQMQHDVDHKVQRISVAHRHVKSHDHNKLEAIMNGQREALTRIVLAQAVVSCWMETQREILQELRSEYSSVALLHPRAARESSTSAEYQQWALHKLSTSYKHLTTAGFRNDPERHRLVPSQARSKRCAKAFAWETLGHCLPGVESTTSLQHEYQACIGHPQSVWWEWHNAIPIRMANKKWWRRCDLSEDEEKRLWTHSIGTARRTANYTRVQKGGGGTVVSFREEVPLWVGVIKMERLFKNLTARAAEKGSVQGWSSWS